MVQLGSRHEKTSNCEKRSGPGQCVGPSIVSIRRDPSIPSGSSPKNSPRLSRIAPSPASGEWKWSGWRGGGGNVVFIPRNGKREKKSTAPLSLHHASLSSRITSVVRRGCWHCRSPRLLAFYFDALGSLLPPERPKLRVPRASPSQLGLVHVAIRRRERIGVFCLHAAHCRFGACSFLLSSWRGTQAIPWLIPSECNLSS